MPDKQKKELLPTPPTPAPPIVKKKANAAGNARTARSVKPGGATVDGQKTDG